MPTPSAFHVHVDAQTLMPEFVEFLRHSGLGFWPDDFSHLPESDAYEPPHHWTLKPPTRQEQERIEDAVIGYLTAHPGAMTGYVECEAIVRRLSFEPKPFDPTVPLPFRFTSRSLPSGEFRETEMHVSLNRDQSDPRLHQALHDMGFFVGYIERPHGMSAVYTAQGYRRDVMQIWDPICLYLEQAGGSVNCDTKEEVITRYWMSDPDIYRPPVLDTITWSKQ